MEDAEELDERQFYCSSCLEVFPESAIHVIPYFNDAINQYVTTYRCAACWLPSLEETRLRIAKSEDPAEIASFAAFLKGHAIFVHEFMRGDPLPAVRPLLVRVIDGLKSENIKLKTS